MEAHRRLVEQLNRYANCASHLCSFTRTKLSEPPEKNQRLYGWLAVLVVACAPSRVGGIRMRPRAESRSSPIPKFGAWTIFLGRQARATGDFLLIQSFHLSYFPIELHRSRIRL